MGEEVVAGRYRLGERLGTGAMVEVWAAEDRELGRRVALKMLGRDANRARFEREARAAAGLAHPIITQLYDYGATEGGRPYMVLELLTGGTLEDLLTRDRPLPDDETARIAAEVADFGIARVGGAGTLTEAGTVPGTAAYISPEQAAGETATATSDVYSFGVILYRMLSEPSPTVVTTVPTVPVP